LSYVSDTNTLPVVQRNIGKLPAKVEHIGSIKMKLLKVIRRGDLLALEKNELQTGENVDVFV
jgi:hypothetical protein